jgi:tetratricopeptide (TPR) repeat protein
MEGGTLAEKIDESTLRAHFRKVLSVPANASIRQMARIRDREIGICQEALESVEVEVSQKARARVESVKTAYECLSDHKSFRLQLDELNKQLEDGKVKKSDLLKIVEAPKEAVRKMPKPSASRDKQALEDFRQKRQEEKSVLPEKGENRVWLDETSTEIKVAAFKAASDKAQDLRGEAHEEPDSDTFFEIVHAASFDAAKETLQAKTKAPYFFEFKDELEALVEEFSEEGTWEEYNRLESAAVRKAEVKSTPNKMTVMVSVLLLIVLGLVFTNVGVMMTVGESLDHPKAAPDKEKMKTILPEADLGYKSKSLSTVKEIAWADGLARPASSAGVAGRCSDNLMAGAADYNKGCELISRNKFDDALPFLTAAVVKNEKLYQGYYNLGCVHLQKCEPAAARADFYNTLKWQPTLAQAVYNQGLVYLISSEETIKQAYAKSPIDKEMAQRTTATLQAAVDQFLLAESMEPRMMQAYYNEGLARYRLNDLENALKAFEKSLELDPTVPGTIRNKDLCKKMIASPDSAKKMFAIGSLLGPVGPQGPPGPGYN